MVLTVEEDSGIVIKQRHAFLRRKCGIDERRVVMGEISQHEMLYVVFAVRRHDTAIELKKDILVVASGLATYIESFSETEQCTETNRGGQTCDRRVRLQGWGKDTTDDSLRSLGSIR